MLGWETPGFQATAESLKKYQASTLVLASGCLNAVSKIQDVFLIGSMYIDICKKGVCRSMFVVSIGKNRQIYDACILRL